MVLPLLQSEVVATGWVTEDAFIAGYGATQAVPGPLFTFAAYLGAVAGPQPNGVAGAAIALVAIFLPGMLLLVGALPFWARLRGSTVSQAALRGANAAVVGLLLAAFYDPVWRVAILSRRDFGLALGALLRNTAAAITTLTLLLFVVPAIVDVLPWADSLGPYLPGMAGLAIVSLHPESLELGPWEGFGVLCAYVVVTMGAAAVMLMRRDA